MKSTILIGGKAGQGINKTSEIIANILTSRGYYIFNYRDYQSLIRGGHNFNLLTISDKKVSSNDTNLDCIIALDRDTINFHKDQTTKNTEIISFEEFKDLGLNANIAQASAYLKTIGVDLESIKKEVTKHLKQKEIISAIEKGHNSRQSKKVLPTLKNKISIMTGTEGAVKGLVNSQVDLYIGYPMTPATPLLHELIAKTQTTGIQVFQPESEVAAINQGLGASFTGKKVVVGTSGGGFDLMTEGLSFQGMSEIPLTIYLASRSGPSTGLPTYTSQADLNVALYSGHGEFPRVLIAPGDVNECTEKINEAVYLSEKFRVVSLFLTDKHLAESQFSHFNQANKPLNAKITRDIPGRNKIVKATSYEHNSNGNTVEDAKTAKENNEMRLNKLNLIEKETKNFEEIKIHGKENSKNLIISWGSSKGAILDALDELKEEKLDAKFLQVLYISPFPTKEILDEIKKAKKVILIEQNLMAQLGNIITQNTGFLFENKNKILKYDGRPFYCNELKEILRNKLK